MFQLVGYPCCHAIAALDYHRLEVEGYIDDCFSKAVYMKVCSNMVNPVPGIHDCEDSGMGKVQPPDVIIKVGRPKKSRRSDANDVRENATTSRKGLTHTCAICFSKGHNKRSCTNPPHPNSKFTQNPNQGRQRCSTSHAAVGSREGRQSPSAAEQPPFDEIQTYYSEMPQQTRPPPVPVASKASHLNPALE
ncbi:UNVERIFIED_CONTAM: hypothetical protein Slati_3186900 [Sesamum latifolium]|uniref:SWIM-type domain-containing protein n=1 Tax=Sesamum latifolium TaxID=2727402 RepID=A0AAW2UXF8_9LAMI